MNSADRTPAMHRSFATKQALVFLLFFGLALILTYPLVLQFGDHVPGTTTWSMDEYGYVWNNWWFKHAVLDLGTNPFQTDMLFYPLGTSLVLYTFTWLHVLLGLPVQLLFGLVPASNSELLFAFVLSGYGAYLLSDYILSKSSGALNVPGRIQFGSALAAGAVYAFASNRFVYSALGHYNVVGTEWIPFYVLFLIKTIDEPRRSNAILAGIFAALAMYVETTDGVLIFLSTVVMVVASWRKLLNWQVLARMALMTCTAFVLFAPLLVPTISEIANSGYSMPGWGHAENLLVDLLGFLTPTALNPMNRHWVEELDLVRQSKSQFVDVNTVFVGYITIAFAFIAVLTTWRRAKVWFISSAVFAVLSLGPLLHINGQSTFDLDGLQTNIPMPFLLLHYIPLLRENRVPNRFSVLLMLALAMLVGYGMLWLARRLSFRAPSLGLGVIGVCSILILAEHSAIPVPLTDARVPSVYETIAKEPGDFAILTLPLGWRNSFGQLGAEDTRVQYYQSVHGKKLFSGNIQRNPPYLFDYFDRLPVFHSLAEIELYRPISAEQIAKDRQVAPYLMALLNVRYLVVHPSIQGRPPYSDTRNAALDYLNQVLPMRDKIYDENGIVAYRVDIPPLLAKTEAQFGTSAAHIFQADGWDRDDVILGEQANWANRTTARLIVPADGKSEYDLTLRALPFTFPNSTPQSMQVAVNGRVLDTHTLANEWQDYKVGLPSSALRQGPNDIELKFAYTAVPRTVLQPHYGIGATEISSPVDIIVNSGPLGSIKVKGKEVSLLGKGYNVVVLDPISGAVKDSKVFNTADERSESRALTDYIRQIPNGSIVAVASQENAAENLGDQTVAALATLGAKIDLRTNPGHSHAVIGVKGVSSGSALEESSAGTSFVWVGRTPDDRTLAAAISHIAVEKK